MATNMISTGEILTLPAPAAVASGSGVLIGKIFGIAVTDAASGAEFALATTGVYELPKASAQAWTLGASVYWDNTAKNVTTSASGNTLIGAAVAVAANPSATGMVRLNGSF